MRIKTCFKFIPLLPLLFLTFLISTRQVSADTTDYGITIVKYKLNDSQLTGNNLPTQPSGSDLGDDQAKGSNGEALSVFPGVTYQVEKVVLVNGTSQTFEVAPDNVTQMITTDANGRAHLALSEGIYRITEQSNTLLPNPAAPILIQLPTTLQNGDKINQVYIYPKSSVVTPGTSTVPPTPPSSTGYTSIPQTSGDLNSAIPLYLLLSGVAFVGVLSLIMNRKKRL